MEHYFVVSYNTETKRFLLDAESTGYAFPSGETWMGEQNEWQKNEWIQAYGNDTPLEITKSFEKYCSALAGLLESYSDTLVKERSTE